jgi:hypothetical protein
MHLRFNLTFTDFHLFADPLNCSTITDKHLLRHLNMLCLLYEQHRPITLLYNTFHPAHDATVDHPTLVSLNLEKDEASAPALHVLCTSEGLVYYRSLPGYEGWADDYS